MTFRARSALPVPPALRPRKERKAARVILTDGNRVLLFTDTDPGVPGSAWWVTPGGGIDPGEDSLAAAVRELKEETGLEVEPEQLLGPIATRVVTHGYSDQILIQAEDFYLLRTEPFEVDVSGHTEHEQITLSGHDWVEVSDPSLGTIWPAVLPALLALADSPELWPVDLGPVEESTVPLG